MEKVHLNGGSTSFSSGLDTLERSGDMDDPSEHLNDPEK
jgi:hypothetical protein